MSKRPTSSIVTSSDGRLLRSARSRAKMVRALYELVGEGEMWPTARQVADRAGVGIRTVFRQFSDMETLYAEMDVMFTEEALPFLNRDPEAGTLAERTSMLLRSRCTGFEKFEPYLRSTRLHRAHSAFLQDRYSTFLNFQREQLRSWLPEFASAPRDWCDAMETATSFEQWDDLRSTRALSKSRTRAAMERMIRVLAADLD